MNTVNIHVELEMFNKLLTHLEVRYVTYHMFTKYYAVIKDEAGYFLN